jgi:hypothetical protein
MRRVVIALIVAPTLLLVLVVAAGPRGVHKLGPPG